jgi:hypothetical protein
MGVRLNKLQMDMKFFLFFLKVLNCNHWV